MALGTPTSFKLVYDTEERCWYLHVGINMTKEQAVKEMEENADDTVLEQQDTVVRTTEVSQAFGLPSGPSALAQNILPEVSKPLAFFSIDFGMEREATTVLVVNNRQQKTTDIQTFDLPEKRANLTNSIDR